MMSIWRCRCQQLPVDFILFMVYRFTTLPSAFYWWGDDRSGGLCLFVDLCNFCKVVVSMFTHAASDLIRACSPFTGFTSESMLRFTDQQIACPDCRFVCGCGLICTYTTGTGLGDWHCISISFGMHWSKSPATPTFPHLSPGPSIGLLFTLLFWDRNTPAIYQFHWCLTSLLPLCKWHCCPVGDHQLCYFPFCSICPSVDETQVGFLLILLQYFGVCMSWSWKWPIQVLSHLNQL